MPSFLVGTQDDIDEYDYIDQYTWKYVKSVKTGNKEKEVGKKSFPIFIHFQIGTFYHAFGIGQVFFCFFSWNNNLMFGCRINFFKAQVNIWVGIKAF